VDSVVSSLRCLRLMAPSAVNWLPRDDILILETAFLHCSLLPWCNNWTFRFLVFQASLYPIPSVLQ
jgi:hypothetical protein